jgi:hypothetical protein
MPTQIFPNNSIQNEQELIQFFPLFQKAEILFDPSGAPVSEKLEGPKEAVQELGEAVDGYGSLSKSCHRSLQIGCEWGNGEQEGRLCPFAVELLRLDE